MPGTQAESTAIRYLSYLLRLWQVEQDGENVWLASLQDPRTGERYGFARLELLFEFIQDQVSRSLEDSPGGQNMQDR